MILYEKKYIQKNIEYLPDNIYYVRLVTLKIHTSLTVIWCKNFLLK